MDCSNKPTPVSMSLYLIIKTIHILSATILFGTGIGIAFFMLRSYFAADIKEKPYAASSTVLADYVFTLPAGIIQLITGFWLVWNSGYSWTSHWLLVSLGLFLLAGVCWLPVVMIQIKIKKLLLRCSQQQAPIPSEYRRLFKIWFVLGWPSFFGLTIIFYMMVVKPA